VNEDSNLARSFENRVLYRGGSRDRESISALMQRP